MSRRRMWLGAVFSLLPALCLGAAVSGDRDVFYYGLLPDTFSWGVSTAAYQIEGAWNEDGKSEHIWDRFCHEGGHVDLNATGDVACDSYHKWRDDVTILNEVGVNHYRMSLSWSRLVPNPLTGVVNKAAVAHYLQVLAALKQAGIKPLVTLFHWDLPQILEDHGSWGNDSIVDMFEHYADVAFGSFGHLVPYWITFNEPWVITWQGYGKGDYAPGVQEPATLPYLYAHNIIKCHASAWHLYDRKYRARFHGKVSITLNTDFFAPRDPDDPQHVQASERAAQFSLGWFANPIYVNGDYPQVMKEYVQRHSPQGHSRLPEFTSREQLWIKGTFDFFGLNHYSTSLCEPADAQYQATVPLGYLGDMEVKLSRDPTWHQAASYYLFYVPWGMRGILNYIRTHYQNVPVMVTENGVTDNNGTLRDSHRVEYLRSYIDELIKAVRLDGCNVIGYTVWSIVDNFEWARGYTERFGIYYVDFNDPERRRVPKDSSRFYKRVIADRGFPDPGIVG